VRETAAPASMTYTLSANTVIRWISPCVNSGLLHCLFSEGQPFRALGSATKVIAVSGRKNGSFAAGRLRLNWAQKLKH